MSFARAIFVFALLTPILGATGSKFVVSALLGESPKTVIAPSAVQADTLPKQVMVPVATAPPVTPTLIPSPTSMPTVAIGVTATATPTVSPTGGTASLTRYWVGKASARAGDIIPIGYEIANDTGQAMQLALGVSIKPSTAPSWNGAIADPSHDVTASVAPGTTTHERFFTVPTGLAPGTYDVAWGLKDASGQQVAVVVTAAALHIIQ